MILSYRKYAKHIFQQLSQQGNYDQALKKYVSPNDLRNIQKFLDNLSNEVRNPSTKARVMGRSRDVSWSFDSLSCSIQRLWYDAYVRNGIRNRFGKTFDCVLSFVLIIRLFEIEYPAYLLGRNYISRLSLIINRKFAKSLNIFTVAIWSIDIIIACLLVAFTTGIGK